MSKLLYNTDAHRQHRYWQTDNSHRPINHPVVSGFAQQRWRYINKLLPTKEIKRALDVGCGTGFSTYYAPENIKFTACDFSINMLSRNPGQRKVCSDIMHLPFSDNSFDLVICWEVLHHLPDPYEALREMNRLARKWLILFEPNPLNIFQALFAVIDREHRWVLRFSKSYVLAKLSQAGFLPVQYKKVGLIFPNKTPLAMYHLLKYLPFHIPFIGISHFIIAKKGI